MKFVGLGGRKEEVTVQTGKGLITGLRIKEDSGNVEVSIQAENLRHPIKGWTNIKDPLYQQIQENFEQKNIVDYRFESQRKKNIDPSTPIEELKQNATSNLTNVFAGLNGTLTQEAVTHPNNDPKKPNSRILAEPHQTLNPTQETEKMPHESNQTDSTLEKALQVLRSAAQGGGFMGEVVNSLAATALLNGASEQDILQAVGNPRSNEPQQQPTETHRIAPEAPAYKVWNNDGRPNLGSYNIAAAISVQRFVRNHLQPDTPQEIASYYQELLLAIADRIQISAYGKGFAADRTATSHTHIRGILFSLLEEAEPSSLPAQGSQTKTEHDEWIKFVGSTVRKRFEDALNLADKKILFKTLSTPENLFADEEKNHTSDEVEPDSPTIELEETYETHTETQETEEENLSTQKIEAAEIEKNLTGADKTNKLEYLQKIASGEIKVAFEQTEDAEQNTPTAATNNPLENLPPHIAVFPLNPLNSAETNDEEQLATEETREEFKLLVEEANLNPTQIERIRTLLTSTFGEAYNKIALIPEIELGDFVDFYSANGVENFKELLNNL